MPSAVTIEVDEPTKAAEYYTSLLGIVTKSKSAGSVTLADEHAEVILQKASDLSPAETTLALTSGMLARILEMAMKARCKICVDSAEQVTIEDRYGHRWILRCEIG